MNYIYLHGFASGPGSRKAQDLRDRFQSMGYTLHIPDLNTGGFSSLTLSRQIQQIQTEYLADGQPITILGSSFGGLTAAWLGQHCPSVQQLVLLAPAFQFLTNWRPRIPDEQWQQWQQTGTMAVYHYGQEQLAPLEYGFVQDLENYHESDLTRPVPTLIIHGVHDDVVPVQVSVDYAKARSHVTLLQVHSDHSLTDRLDKIWLETARVCGF